MTTQVSNNEILGDVYLPTVEKYEYWMTKEEPEYNTFVQHQQEQQHESKYFKDKQEMQTLKFDEGGDFEVSMNMQPISDEEQQWNGDELANVQLNNMFIPTAPGDEGSVDFGGQQVLSQNRQEVARIESPQQFSEDLKQLQFQTDRAAFMAEQERQEEAFKQQFAQRPINPDFGMKIHSITGTEQQYNGDFEGYTGY